MKKILFVIESLTLGGAEKSLVTLLNLLDYSKYEVDLLLFAQGGAFQELLPREVNLLSVPEYFIYNTIPWSNIGKKIQHPKMMIAQLRYSIALRTRESNNIQKAVMFWKSNKTCFKVLRKQYDIAIAYAQGVPTFYVAEKVQAEKKIAWINATYIPTGKDLEFIKKYYNSYKYINGVSITVTQQIKQTFNISNKKIVQIADILDENFALRMAEMKSEVFKDISNSGYKILTVGRLAKMKGYDLAIAAAKILKEKGIDFCWYVVGEGSLRSQLENQIRENNLEKNFILLGSRSNPYPYFKNCDIYVQSSKYEGFGITLAEAKMFHKPIVTTNFEAVNVQFQNEKNGLIVDISAEGIANGIIRMIEDKKLCESCITNLCNEKVGNEEELEKFYSLING